MCLIGIDALSRVCLFLPNRDGLPCLFRPDDRRIDLHGRLGGGGHIPTASRICGQRRRHFIHLVAVADDGTEHRQEIADLMRAEAWIETAGLTLAESTQVLDDRPDHHRPAGSRLSRPAACLPPTAASIATSRSAAPLRSGRFLAWFRCPIRAGVIVIHGGGRARADLRSSHGIERDEAPNRLFHLPARRWGE